MPRMSLVLCNCKHIPPSAKLTFCSAVRASRGARLWGQEKSEFCFQRFSYQPKTLSWSRTVQAPFCSA